MYNRFDSFYNSSKCPTIHFIYFHWSYLLKTNGNSLFYFNRFSHQQRHHFIRRQPESIPNELALMCDRVHRLQSLLSKRRILAKENAYCVYSIGELFLHNSHHHAPGRVRTDQMAHLYYSYLCHSSLCLIANQQPLPHSIPHLSTQ